MRHTSLTALVESNLLLNNLRLRRHDPDLEMNPPPPPYTINSSTPSFGPWNRKMGEVVQLQDVCIRESIQNQMLKYLRHQYRKL